MSYACIYMYITASVNHVKMRLSYFYKSIVKLVHNHAEDIYIDRGLWGGGGNTYNMKSVEGKTHVYNPKGNIVS